MKKIIVTILVVIFTVISMATTNEVVNPSNNSKEEVSQMPRCPKCDGDMTVRYNLLFEWRTCPSCKGKGYLIINNKREQCSGCKKDGRPGYYKQYVPAHQCKSCGYAYKI